jgi:hypothetical protein
MGISTQPVQSVDQLISNNVLLKINHRNSFAL